MGASCTLMCNTFNPNDVAEYSFNDVVFKIDLTDCRSTLFDLRTIDFKTLELIEYCLSLSGEPKYNTILKDIHSLSQLDSDVLYKQSNDYIMNHDFQDPMLYCHRMQVADMLDELASINLTNADRIKEQIPVNQVASCIRVVMQSHHQTLRPQDNTIVNGNQIQTDEDLDTFIECQLVFSDKDSLYAENQLIFYILMKYQVLERQYELIQYILSIPHKDKNKQFPLNEQSIVKEIEQILFYVINQLKVQLKQNDQVDQDMIESKQINEIILEDCEDINMSQLSNEDSLDMDLDDIWDTNVSMMNIIKRRSKKESRILGKMNNDAQIADFKSAVTEIDVQTNHNSYCAPNDDFECRKGSDLENHDDCSNIENETINGD